MVSSDFRGHHQKDVEIVSVVSLIEETVKTLDFAEQLKIQLDSNLT